MGRDILERLGKIKEGFMEKKEVLLMERLRMIEHLLQQKKKNEEWKKKIDLFLVQKEEGCLVLSFLRSSYLTESHKFLLTFYREEPFLEEEPDYMVLDLYHFFASTSADLQKLKKEIEKKFVHIFAAEQEEIRRWYMEELYQGFGRVLFSIVEKQEEGMDIFYGGFMEELNWIGRIKVLEL